MGNNEGLCRRCGEIEPHGMDCECPCEPCFGLHPDHIADAGKNVQPATPLLDALEVGNPVVQPTPAPLPEGVESDMEEATAVLRKVQDVLRNEDLLFAAEGLRSVFHALSHISDLTRRLAEAEAENGRFAGMLEDSVSGWRKLYTEERAERVRIEGVLLNDVQAERQESDEHINGLNVVIKTQDKTIRDLKSRVELAADWQVQFAKAEARVRELERALSDEQQDHRQTTRVMAEMVQELEKALSRMVAIGYTHEIGCHPSEGRHTKGCVEKKAALAQAKAALAATEVR